MEFCLKYHLTYVTQVENRKLGVKEGFPVEGVSNPSACTNALSDTHARSSLTNAAVTEYNARISRAIPTVCRVLQLR